HFLDGVDQLINERIQFVGRGSGSAQSEIQRIVKVLLVVGTGIEKHGHQKLRWHSSASGVELKLADGNRSAVCPDISEAEDSATIRNADEPNIVLGPVL